MVVLLRLVVLDARCRAPSAGPARVLALADTQPRGHGRRLGTGAAVPPWGTAIKYLCEKKRKSLI